MSRKPHRRLLRLVSAVPGLYSLLAFAFARRADLDGLSMAPTLIAGERVLFDRLAYIRGHPGRGDIVLAQHPRTPGLRIVKRITGLPGDVTPDDTHLGRGEYWLEGDNPDSSTDSRQFGPVRRRHLLARGWIVYWPAANWRRL